MISLTQNQDACSQIKNKQTQPNQIQTTEPKEPEFVPIYYDDWWSYPRYNYYDYGYGYGYGYDYSYHKKHNHKHKPDNKRFRWRL